MKQVRAEGPVVNPHRPLRPGTGELMMKVTYKLVPRLVYTLLRTSTTETAVLQEKVADYTDLVTANRAARACVEYERRNPPNRETAVEIFQEYQPE